MTGNAVNHKWRALFVASALVLFAVPASGCLGQEEEGGGGGEPTPTSPTPTTPANGGDGGNDEPRPAWEETFLVSENVTALYVNLTIAGFSGATGDFEACLIDPTGSLVDVETGSIDGTVGTAAANLTWTAGGQAGGDVTDAQRCPAESEGTGEPTADMEYEWTFQVWSDARLLVASEIVVIDPTAEEEEA